MSMQGTRVTASPSQVRMFLKADTPEELVSLQLQINTLLKGRADYTDIQFVKGSWYAWFLVDVDQNAEVLSVLTEKPVR